jgi:hypothetical protein
VLRQRELEAALVSASTPTVSAPQKEAHRVVCGGLAETKDNKLVSILYEIVNEAAFTDRPLIWNAIKADPGCVYTLYCDPGDWQDKEKRIYIPKGGRIEYAGTWSNLEQRQLWRAEAKAVRDRHERARMEKQEQKENVLRDAVKPLAAIYKKLPFSQRTAFLIGVQEMIVRMGSSKTFDLSSDD